MGLASWLRQTGHEEATSESAGGRDTVNIGRYEVAEIGGGMRLRGEEVLRADLGDDTPVAGACFSEGFCFRSDGGIIPFVMGAGMSRVSVALRAS